MVLAISFITLSSGIMGRMSFTDEWAGWLSFTALGLIICTACASAVFVSDLVSRGGGGELIDAIKNTLKGIELEKTYGRRNLRLAKNADGSQVRGVYVVTEVVQGHALPKETVSGIRLNGEAIAKLRSLLPEIDDEKDRAFLTAFFAPEEARPAPATAGMLRSA